MKNGSKLSVIVPVFNKKIFLTKCLDSLAKQTYRDMEIILVDDGSTDGAGEICNQYAEMFTNFFVVHQKQSGRVKARQRGVEESSGSVLAFVDGDDWFEVNGYERLMRIMDRTEADIVAFGWSEEWPTGSRIVKNRAKPGVYQGDNLEYLKDHSLCESDFFSFGILPSLCVKLFSRNVILKSGFLKQDGKIEYGEDAAAVTAALYQSEKVVVCTDTPYHYRQDNYTQGLKTIHVPSISICRLYQAIKSEARGRQVPLYMWFVLLLRAYGRVRNITDNRLFPYEKAKLGQRLLIYGAGGFGREVYKALAENKDYVLTGWVDRMAEQEEMKKMGVESLSVLKEREYDGLLIAILDEKLGCRIKNDLIKSGIEKEIHVISTDFLLKMELPKWLEEEV